MRKHWERGLLAALVASSLLVNYHYRLRGFGEPDQARIGIFVLAWREAGVFSTDTYLDRTSPIYLLLARLALDHGVTRAGLADVLNVANVVVGSLALVPMFVLFRTIARDAGTAFLALGVFWLAPTFFYGNCYGMPHIPALAMLLVSLSAFAIALERRAALSAPLVSFAVLAMAAAAGFKADVSLCALAFPALLPLLGPVTHARVLVAMFIPAFGLGAALLLSSLLLPVPATLTDFAVAWSRQSPFDLRTLFESSQVRVVARSLGPFVWGAAGVVAAFTVVRTAALGRRWCRVAGCCCSRSLGRFLPCSFGA